VGDIYLISYKEFELLERQAQREFKAIRSQVLKRDNYICQRCGPPDKYGYRLHVHHMNREDDVRINSMDNLITLCTMCHGEVDADRRACENEVVQKFNYFLSCTIKYYPRKIIKLNKEKLTNPISHFIYIRKTAR
jgi:HNH endonuclease